MHLAANSWPASAQNDERLEPAPTELILEEVFVLGSYDVRELPGSAARIGNEQIRIEVANDINQLLKTVPGVYIREEDGYGLRPNIGIRGATSERSSKITLLEDGVLMAPAPYSGPAAYYFPSTLRTHQVEVLKGAPLLRQGPQTTGGVINVISTPIPEEFGGNLQLRAGENGEADFLGNIGGRSGPWGWLLETVQRQSDGFKDIDRGNQGSGFELEDYVAKLSYDRGNHSLFFKAQYSDEVSDETYLGLSDADFERDPNRRYGLSSIDQMNAQHESYVARYRYALSDTTDFTVLGYNNIFERSWFRLINGSVLVDLANQGVEPAQAGLDGDLDLFNLEYRDNARDYYSRGVELAVNHAWSTHQTQVAVRVHEDEVDRAQPIEIYDQIDGELIFVETVEPTGLDNRIDDAEALSLVVTDKWSVSDALSINLALRYEEVETRRTQFADPDRTIIDVETFNRSTEWLPGVSLTYDFSDAVQVIAGVHRGFSPLGGGAQSFEDPETAINYELGWRYNDEVFFEAIAFYSDFSNKTENCSNANPCSNGDINGSFTTGTAVIQGLEVQLSDYYSVFGMGVPVDVAYTFTDASLSEDLPEEAFEEGDDLASVPRNTFSLRVGIEPHSRWGNYFVIKYIDDMCVDIGCNRSSDVTRRTESLWVADFMSRLALGAGGDATLFLKVENMLDEQAIVSRQPDGARPNKPRTASVGFQYAF